DDADALDRPSLDAIAFTARRVGAHRVTLLLTQGSDRRQRSSGSAGARTGHATRGGDTGLEEPRRVR
ncbi:hypothetical protein, partial [Catellatospora sp. NPDC049133]|uniref:hypothetical protein n=1 Tax=Catellatospora sp. NPDC049133 TaxID=3155499 RepID=UPI003403201E